MRSYDSPIHRRGSPTWLKLVPKNLWLRHSLRSARNPHWAERTYSSLVSRCAAVLCDVACTALEVVGAADVVGSG